jgi:UDP-3-O-acyl-N-acetylglucosamine deacetylase
MSIEKHFIVDTFKWFIRASDQRLNEMLKSTTLDMEEESPILCESVKHLMLMKSCTSQDVLVKLDRDEVPL